MRFTGQIQAGNSAKIQEWGIKISEDEAKLANIKISDLEVISTANRGLATQTNTNPIPGHAIVPVQIVASMPMQTEKTLMMQAIMLRILELTFLNCISLCLRID